MTAPRFVRRTAAIACLALAFAACAPVAAQGDPLAQADQLLQKGEFERALASVDGHLASRPNDARGRFLKGVILGHQNKSKEAIAIFTDLTREFPDLAEPYNNLAVLHAAQGDYDKARAALEMAVRVRPDYGVAHENLGDIYAKLAGRAYDRAAQLDRRNRTAAVKLKLVTELLSAKPGK